MSWECANKKFIWLSFNMVLKQTLNKLYVWGVHDGVLELSTNHMYVCSSNAQYWLKQRLYKLFARDMLETRTNNLDFATIWFLMLTYKYVIFMKYLVQLDWERKEAFGKRDF